MQPRVLVISPVRNEAAHIERVVRGVAAQERPPTRWIVRDDHSDDDTLAILRRLAREVDFMTVLAAEDGASEPVRDRLACALDTRNFNAALATVDWRDYTHVMKLDGDIELPPSYLRELMERFAADATLGVAGGVIKEPARGGRLRRVVIPRHHVHGALKCYSNACFAAIGGLEERLGWDTIDGTYARMRGFRTHSFTDLVCIHHRQSGSADGTLRGHARHGECAYVAQYTALWVALRALKVARHSPAGVSGIAFFYGFVRAAARGVERVPDPEYRRFTRSELRQRMLGALRRTRRA